MIEAVGRAVSIETETIIAIWILPRRSSRLYKGKMIIWRPKWTESSLQKLECVYSPQRQKIVSFSGSPTVALARLLLQSTPGVQCSETLLRSSPTLQTLQTLRPPTTQPLAFVRFDPPACQAGLTSAGSVAAGSDGCLLGRIHFPCGYVVYVLLCC